MRPSRASDRPPELIASRLPAPCMCSWGEHAPTPPGRGAVPPGAREHGGRGSPTDRSGHAPPCGTMGVLATGGRPAAGGSVVLGPVVVGGGVVMVVGVVVVVVVGG